MAPESCNLGKDEAEILKPSSPSSNTTSSSSPPPSNPSPSSASSQLPPPFLSMEPPHQAQRSEGGPETAIASPIKASSPRRQEKEPHPPVQFSNRCSTCQKRIGLTGFPCRCGDLFCARHRYSDTHGCSFDYKSAGREEISKANPVIKAAKIIKI